MTDRTLFLGGEWTAGAATVEVTNPATGELVGTTSVADRPAVEAAIATATRGQAEWWRLGAGEPDPLEVGGIDHTDFDHVGSLPRLLADNSQLRVITTFLSAGIMTLSTPLPMDRVHLLNPGQKITVGDRTLTAVRPPAFDNPSTTGFVDDTSGSLFSSDCFGALLADVPHNAADLSDDELRQAQVLWATVDSPWLHNVDSAEFAKELDRIRQIEPTMILSSHLPAAPGNLIERLLGALAAAPTAQPFVGPDQAALEQVLAGMAAGGDLD